MTAHIAAIAFTGGILGLFALNRDSKARTSKALWIPVVWVSIGGSRMVSQWLTVTGLMRANASIDPAQVLLDGNPLDRFLFSGLVAFGIIVLAGRAQRVGALLRANRPIVLFFVYCGASALWSDFPDVTFKRWIKALGDVIMIMIVLTDLDVPAAIKRLLTRVGFLLVPLSLLLGKYYPALGRGWSEWGGSYCTGVATSKNGLGAVCLLFGVGSAWCFCEALRERHSAFRTRRLIAHTIFLAMVLWLFRMSSMMTATSCFLMATTLIVVAGFRRVARNPAIIHLCVAAMVSVSVFALFLDNGGGLVQDLGRNPTLTGRTSIWHLVLGMTGNRWLGTGYESFWLGPRLEKIWSVYWWHPNEAHNGYIEVLLTLGWIGVGLLAVVMVTGYRKVFSAFRHNRYAGRLWLAYFVVGVIYNCTESAVRTLDAIWIFFLLSIMAASIASDVGTPPALCTNDADEAAECEPSEAHAVSVDLLQGGS